VIVLDSGTRQLLGIDVPKALDVIKRARERAGLTQAELADKLGITSNHYARLERGEFPMQRQTLLAICTVLGLKIPKE